MGCPREKSAEMAAQLHRRATQLAEQKGRSYEDAMAHLLGLMRQGWAASQAPAPSLKPWKKTGSRHVGDFRIFTIRSDEKISPRTGKRHEFYVIDSVNWVNVVALTPDRQVVMVEQYRHGSNTVELEIPGGLMDPEDVRPELTAERELREETGYAGENARLLGQVYANPAIMSNTCFTVIVENCRCVHPVQFDHGEDLITRLVSADEIPGLVASGKIQHPMVVTGLFFFDLWLRGIKKL